MMASNSSMLAQPILFAHRGGRSHGADNSLETFRLALRKGIGGLESDVRLTADGVCVLAHDPTLWWKGLRHRIAKKNMTQLPSSLLSLAGLYDNLGGDFELSLDIKTASKRLSNEMEQELAAKTALAAVICASEFEQRIGKPVVSRLWLCHSNWELLASWRQRWPDVKLVNSTSLNRLKEGRERRTAQLAEAGIDALNMPHPDWTKGFVTLAHRFGVLAFGWDAHLERVIAELMNYGIDGIYGDNVDKLLSQQL